LTDKPFHYCAGDAFLRDQVGTILHDQSITDGWSRGDGRRDWNAKTAYQDSKVAAMSEDRGGQLCLKIERASDRIFRMTIQLEIVKQIGLRLVFKKQVSRHRKGIGPFQCKRRGCRQHKSWSTSRSLKLYFTKGKNKWYTWTTWYLIRELFNNSGLQKEAVGEMESNHHKK
jgi:hypothetical protein